MTQVITGYNPTWGHHRNWACWDSGSTVCGSGNSRQEAVDNLIEKSSIDNVPADWHDAFESDMAEKSIHHDFWTDRFWEWLADRVEVVDR